MVTLTIDNQSITVPKGTTVLDAAEKLGIVVPHFCYHEALGAVGACRLCAVYIETEQSKGVQMSCLVEAAEGMVVNTLEPTAVELRQHVIEWLMTNHPHDCPVCDEGGECQLQDMTIAGGQSIRRYRGKKRTYSNQELGPFIEQEMNRCIQCYRCVRTYRDYFGGTDFGVMGSRNRVFFGRFEPGRLESPFSGNLADVCPTGVFTDKTYRFKSRYWDLQEAESICPHCSLGCATIPGGRYRELQRVRSGTSKEVNGHFLCDRGRFGYGYVNHPDRQRVPRINGEECDWHEAFAAINDKIEKLGGEAVGFLGSSRTALETNAMIKSWAEQSGSKSVCFECHPQRDNAARSWVALRGDRGRSLADIRRSDFILLLGSDPLNEAPMLAAAIRQAESSGSQVAVIDARPVKLPFKAAHLVVRPEKLSTIIRALKSGAFDNFERHEQLFFEGVLKSIKKAERPILVGGGDLLQAEGVAALCELMAQLPEAGGDFVHLSGPNSYGAAMLSGAAPDFETILDDIITGKIRALVCVESDPFADYPDRKRLQEALSKLEFLVVADYINGPAAAKADIFLPTAAPAESAGTYINCEGRMQRFKPVLKPGEPLRITGDGGHPPRRFSHETPGDQPRSAAEFIANLVGQPVTINDLRQQIAADDDRFSGLDQPEQGMLCRANGELPTTVNREDVPGKGDDLLHLLPVADLFGSGPLLSYCSALDAVRSAPCVVLSESDAASIGVANGENVSLQTAEGKLAVEVRIDAKALPGLVLIPQTGADAFLPGGVMIPCSIRKNGARDE